MFSGSFVHTSWTNLALNMYQCMLTRRFDLNQFVSLFMDRPVPGLGQTTGTQWFWMSTIRQKYIHFVFVFEWFQYFLKIVSAFPFPMKWMNFIFKICHFPRFFSLISGGFSSFWPSVQGIAYDEIFDQTEKVLVKKAIHHFKD